MKYIIILFWIIIFFSFGFIRAPQEKGLIDFCSMEGKIVTHLFNDKSDSLSGPEIFELQNDIGLPVWFGRHIFKDVCITSKCKMIQIWIFWDGAGNYLGFQLYEEQIPEPYTLLQASYFYPLTKSDHTNFEPEDYKKLDDILHDTTSILKTLKQEDLIIVPDSIDPYEVDGYTAATQPTLADVVVKDAVYTCHTLWHTVYGPVQSEIFRILENYLNKEFLEKMFESKKPEYILWAIKSVKKYPEFHEAYYLKILQFIKSENSILANQALSYFRPEVLADNVIQQQLVQLMADADMNVNYKIIWKFISLNEVDIAVIISLLLMVEDETLDGGAFSLISRLVCKEHVDNKKIAQILKNLSNHENRYIQSMSKKLLNKNYNQEKN